MGSQWRSRNFSWGRGGEGRESWGRLHAKTEILGEAQTHWATPSLRQDVA